MEKRNYHTPVFIASGIIIHGRGIGKDFTNYYPEEWFKSCLAEKGKRFISGIHTNKSGYQVISLSRAFNQSFQSPYDSIVEIQQRYHVLENLVKTSLSNANFASAYIFDAFGEQILEMLSHAYSQMIERLQTSLDDIVTLRSHEIQAQMYALQAQMNPHFLYNTITIISIEADMNQQPQIVNMCECLIGMLRYISAASSHEVTLSDEMHHTNQYLTLMNNRYPGQITVSCELPKELYDVQVPKLILQPIIENCFKYAFNTRPPWEITIRGSITENRWLLQITDNGQRFRDEVLNWINEKMKEETIQFAQKSNERTGLLNIFYRLKIRYREDAVFTITNNDTGGSTICLGGFIR